MKKFLKNLLCFYLLSFCFLKIEKVQPIIPYYYFPTIKNLEKESLSIGKNAYQLLFFGQYEESLNLAKLAVKINAKDEKLWLILSEAQLANNLYKNALNSLDEAQKINTLSMISPITNEEKQKLLEALTIKDKIETLENIISFYLHEVNFSSKTVQ